MRSNINNSSIANVITRFVKASSMLRAGNTPQRQWHLNLCAGSLQGGNSRTHVLFGDLIPVTNGIDDRQMSYLEPSQKQQPGIVVSIQNFFQLLRTS